MELEKLTQALNDSYTKELCYFKVRNSWKQENKWLGMCAITALIVNDYYQGEICKIHVGEKAHYFNRVNDKIIDLTSYQFLNEINYTKYEIIPRKKVLDNLDTTERYLKLKVSVQRILLTQVDKEVHQCYCCGELVEKFPIGPTIYIGKDNDIVLVGEAPANNGWRKSHKLWKDIHGKVLPSGIILQKLFDTIERDVFHTTFLEAVKCYPVDRKNLKICSQNCKKIMERQLDILQPKLIIALGEFPTRKLLNVKFKKFKDVVGKIYEVNGLKILPIYHPSPISPMSYKGNLPIFEKLKNEIQEFTSI